jgi:hypothetical protein
VAGCTNCKGKSGCDDRKGSMFAVLDEVLARAYPGRTWGELDDAALSLGDGDGPALAEELATELAAATFYVPGGPEDLCDFVWVLCTGRTPCLIQAREFGVPLDVIPGPVHERYLRVCVSTVARVAAVQEIAVDAVRGDGGWIVQERPRAGVYDAPLLRRLQRLVAVLPAYDLVHLDFGEIATAPDGFAAGAWPALYAPDGDAAPTIANYLFFPRPPTMVSTTFVPDAPLADVPCSTTR